MAFTVSADVLIRLFLFLLYVPVCLFVYWKLIPRLSPTAKLLASVFLAAQIVVIVIALEIQPSSRFERWLWHLSHEWNIPTTLASTQLALVGGAALMTAWLAKERPAWRRLYLVGIALVFLYLAYDEYAILHETIIRNWHRYYAALGAVVAAATVAVAARSPRHTWIWHLCLLTGLAMSASGGLVLEQLHYEEICDSLGFWHINTCLLFWPAETLEFLGIWLTLVAMLGHFSDALPTPKPRVRRFLYVLPAFWILLIFLNSLIPRFELRFLAQPAAVQFEAGVHLSGVHLYGRIDNARGEVGEIGLLYVSGKLWDYIDAGYSIHLVDQVSGESVASRSAWADRHHAFGLFGPDYMSIYRNRIGVKIPPQTAANRALWIVLSHWRKKIGEDEVSHKILASDHQLLNETQVILGELVIPAASTATPTDPTALFDNGFTLAAAELPERTRPGEILNIRFNWRSNVSGYDDYTQFLHFVHQESGILWNHDQQPLGPRLPTRLWYNGLADSEIWQVPLPADLAPGQYTVFTGLYRQSDLERIPASDIDGKPFLDARVPLGSLMIE